VIDDRRRLVVLGAAGFIGSHVLRECRDRGHDAIGVSREGNFGGAAAVDRASLDLDLDVPRFGEAVCVHLAEPNLQVDSDVSAQNLLRAKHVLAAPFSRIVYCSSAAVYGDQVSEPRREGESVTGTTEYARSKIAVEGLMAADPRCVTVRPANVYGRGMSRRNVLSDILSQLHLPGPIRLRDLAPVRDYVAVKDVADAMLEVAFSDVSGTINIGSGRGTSVLELATIVCEVGGQPGRAITGTSRTSIASHLVLSIERLLEELGWSPSVGLTDGIAQLMQKGAV
jgi:nucleoside-diphosphate-sugar epimerase